MMKAVIIDDEEKARKTLANFLQKYCPQVIIEGEAGSVAEGIRLLSDTEPDIILLDIQLGDGSGFSLLEKLGKLKSKIIFTTAFNEYAVKAFRYSAIDYLLKPIDPDELVAAIDKAKTDSSSDEGMSEQLQLLLQNLGKKNQFEKIGLPTLDGLNFVAIKDIIRCEATGNYTIIHLRGGEKITVSRTLKEYDELLTGSGFFRIHQSHLINMNCLRKYVKGDGGYVVMDDASELEVARRRKDEFLAALGKVKGLSA